MRLLLCNFHAQCCLCPSSNDGVLCTELALNGPLPPLLSLQLLDFQAVLGDPDSPASPSLVLHTGPVVLHSVKEKQFMTAHAAHGLLTAIQAHSSQESPAAEAVEAAISAVEQHLVYQQMDFTVSSLQVVATPATLAGGGHGHGGGGSGEAVHSPRRWQVLQPLTVQGRLKLHRIAEDYGAPQVQCSLQLAPVSLALSPALLHQLSAALQPPAAVPTAAPTPAGGPAATAVAAPVPLAASPTSSGGSGGAASTPLVVVDLRLSTLDVGVIVDAPFGGGPAGASSAASGGAKAWERRSGVEAHGHAHAHLSVASLAASLQVLQSGIRARASLAGLVLRDLTPEQDGAPAVRGLLPRLAKSLAIDSLDATVSVGRGGGSGGGGGMHARVELVDLALQGYTGERGNFIGRWVGLLCCRIAYFQGSIQYCFLAASVSGRHRGHW